MARRPAGQSQPTLDPKGGLFVFHGKDAFLRADYTHQLRAKLEETQGEIETIHFDGTRDAFADVLDECRSFGLMQQHKLVIVEAADQLVKDTGRPLLERYAQAPVEAATLVLRCDIWYKGNGNIDKLIIASGGEVHKCEGLAPNEAAAWAIKRAKEHHDVAIKRDAAMLLVERVGQLGRIDSELGKLAVDAKGGITREMVAEAVGMTREEEVWSIQSLILSAGPEELLTQLRTILVNSKQDQSVVTLWACMDLCRKLHSASQALHQGQNPASVAGTLKLWGQSKDAIMHAAKRIHPVQAGRLLSLAVEADRKNKSGLGRADRLLERLTLQIAGGTR
ncbi:MAG: DNA polymerase III subunit delta [Phycisphaera sp.]|nr:MAG: DNA polymerase III subunit delta [Phycisphaera sp.]